MKYESILYDVDGPVATLTLNRPDKLNAWITQTKFEIIDALNRADEDDNVRALVVTGAGRGFCSGRELEQDGKTFNFAKDKENEADIDFSQERMRDGGGLVALRLFDMKKPVIAAINGAAVGVGVTFTLPMDVRLASTNARFGFVFGRRGIINEACSNYFLPRIVGISRAVEWCCTGRVFSAQEALEGGLVRSVYEPDKLLPAAYALAHEIADNVAPVSVALMRQALYRMLGSNHPMESHQIESRGITLRGRSADAKEGIQAFLEKRAANFPDKPSKDMPSYYPWWQDRPYE